MVRTFESKTYDTNGATPSQNAINMLNAKRAAQNDLAKSGGSGVSVPQFREVGTPVSPQSSNNTIVQLAGKQLQADNLNSYGDCTDKPASACAPKTGGTRRKYRKKKRRTIYGRRRRRT
jgi:hypothetical protein